MSRLQLYSWCGQICYNPDKNDIFLTLSQPRPYPGSIAQKLQTCKTAIHSCVKRHIVCSSNMFSPLRKTVTRKLATTLYSFKCISSSRGTSEEQEPPPVFTLTCYFVGQDLSKDVFTVILRQNLISTLLPVKALPGVLSQTLSAGKKLVKHNFRGHSKVVAPCTALSALHSWCRWKQ